MPDPSRRKIQSYQGEYYYQQPRPNPWIHEHRLDYALPEQRASIRFHPKEDDGNSDALNRRRHRAGLGRVSRASPVQTAVRNCTRDEGRPFEIGSQVLVSNHCKLLSSKAMVVSVAANVGTNPSG